ncbi:MAG: hypothetical protein Q8O30_04925 [Candidatus Omnitrophota bacterium]|nr:hypothetical protein [Candidatus Omnitrophota bacterium]
MLIKNLIFKAVIPFLSLILFFSFSAFSQETVTITTYYPAPFGVYNQLVTRTLGVGDSNASDGLDNLDVPDPATHPGDVWIAGHLGIATTNPQNRLDVAGSAAIGANYAGIQVAPLNGLLVGGDMGVGVISPDCTQGPDVAANHIKFISTDAPNYTVEGVLYYDTSENVLKYYDNTGQPRSLGGAQLQVDQTVPTDYVVLVANPSAPVNVGAEGARASCPAGSVMTGFELYSNCRMGGTTNPCKVAGEPAIFNIERMRAYCTPLQ